MEEKTRGLMVEVEEGLFNRLESASVHTGFSKKAIVVEAVSDWLRIKLPGYQKVKEGVRSEAPSGWGNDPWPGSPKGKEGRVRAEP